MLTAKPRNQWDQYLKYTNRLGENGFDYVFQLLLGRLIVHLCVGVQSLTEYCCKVLWID